MHPEVLDEKRRKILLVLNNFGSFYLAGGTALAFQIGHRISVDFDLFSGNEIPQKLLEKVKTSFVGFSILPAVNNKEELTVLIDGVKVTFLYYPFAVIRDFVKYKDLNFLSAPEIAITKAYTIGRRGSYKDYVDIYFSIFGKHILLEGIIDGANKKYGAEFNDRLFLEQLIYLDDVEEEPIIFLKDRISKDDIRIYLENLVGGINI